jgi:hypothetical protein
MKITKGKKIRSSPKSNISQKIRFLFLIEAAEKKITEFIKIGVFKIKGTIPFL